MIVTKTVTGTEPVSLADMKEYLRVFHTTEDDLITDLITNARKLLETATNLSLVETTIELKAAIHDSFPLPYGPVGTITSITIDDDDVSDDVEVGVVTGTGTLEAEYEAGPYECDMVVKDLVAFLYMNRGGGEWPATVKLWIQNNTQNVWLQ